MPVVPKLPDHRRNVALAGLAKFAVEAVGRDDRTTSDTRGVSAYPMRPERAERHQSVFREPVEPSSPVPLRRRLADTAIPASVADTAGNACNEIVASVNGVASTRHHRRRFTPRPQPAPHPPSSRATCHFPRVIPSAARNLPTPRTAELRRTRVAENWTNTPQNWTHFGQKLNTSARQSEHIRRRAEHPPSALRVVIPKSAEESRLSSVPDPQPMPHPHHCARSHGHSETSR